MKRKKNLNAGDRQREYKCNKAKSMKGWNGTRVDDAHFTAEKNKKKEKNSLRDIKKQ